MTNQHPGPIFKLNRLQCGDTLEYLSHKSDIQISRISAFENEKKNLSEEQIQMLYKIMGLDCRVDGSINEYIETKFLSMYRSIVYMEDYKESYLKCEKWIPEIRLSLCYPKYLLMELLYHLYSNHEFDYEQRFVLLEKYHSYLENYQIQILYDCQGIYYKDRNQCTKSLKYFEMAEDIKGMDMSLSMVLYHKVMVLGYLGKLNEKILCIERARKLFTEQLNMKRSAMISVILAGTNTRLGNFEEAIDIYCRCLPVIETMELKNDLLVTYNNLIWTYLLSKNYKEVVEYGKGTLHIDDTQASIYFYMAYACIELHRKEEAEYYIRLAKEYSSNENEYIQSVIDLFYTILTKNASVSTKEKKLLATYKEAKNCGDYQVKIFVLDMLVSHYEELNDQSKMVIYLREQIEIYKKRK